MRYRVYVNVLLAVAQSEVDSYRASLPSNDRGLSDKDCAGAIGERRAVELVGCHKIYIQEIEELEGEWTVPVKGDRVVRIGDDYFHRCPDGVIRHILVREAKRLLLVEGWDVERIKRFVAGRF